MAVIPKTSITLLKALANESENRRWSEFIIGYEPLMRAFLAERFPTLEADDILQETFLALMKALPNYRYVPDEHGFFHDYLMGVVKHKALDVMSARVRENEKRRGFANEKDCHQASGDDLKWRRSLMNAAVEQLLADETISSRNREIFRHVALLHEAPELVGAMFGVTRGNVDVIKKRLIGRLSAMVEKMSL